MKKVLFVMHRLGFGGAERSLVNLLNELPQEEYRVDVLLFQKKGESENPLKPLKCEKFPKEFEEFKNKYLNVDFYGKPVMFRDNLYLLPYEIDIDKLKVLRCGLYLGEIRKGRFIPSHSLALALKNGEFKNTLDLLSDSEEIKKYLHGETLNSDMEGWVQVTVDGFPIGLGKASGGILKNHFPKHLRI